MKEDPTPAGPAMINGHDVTLLSDPGDEDDYRRKHTKCDIRDCEEDSVGISWLCQAHDARWLR